MRPRRYRGGGRLTKEAAEEIMAHLEAEEHHGLATQLRAAQRRASPEEVLDVWERQEAALTYWVLLLTGVNHEEQVAIAKELLAWQAFLAKDSARVLCVPSSEREAFLCCAEAFGAQEFPALFVGDGPEMENHARVEAGLLASLAGTPGGLQNFFARLHLMVETGMTLREIRDRMAVETFWRYVGVAYDEAKGLFSFSLTATP